jgi:hypothetical protein
MEMIRGAIDQTGSMKEIASRGLTRNPGFAGDRALPAAGHECRDPEIEAGEQSGQTLDSSRSRGYGRYEI